VSDPSDKQSPITSAFDPDFGAVRSFITDMLARGAVAALIAAIIALLTRMRDINTELMGKLASKSRKRPPNEAMRRLQLELPLMWTPAANDASKPRPAIAENKPKTKRGPKNRHAHGRPKLPGHLPRVPLVHMVPPHQRRCPHCDVELKSMGLKTTAEKLDIRPCQFIVTQTQVETCVCPKCRQYLRTADKPDEVVDRWLLGNDLLVQAMVDHYDDAVPFERMERNARQQGVALCANTLASSVGKFVDLFDPITRHIREACLSSKYTALDATRMPVLDPSHPLGIRSGSLWLVEGDHRYAVCVRSHPLLTRRARRRKSVWQ